MAARTAKTRKIVWAVDAFESPGALHMHALQTLHSLAPPLARKRPLRAGPGKVQPEIWLTTVLSPATLSASVEFSGPWVTDLRPMAEERLERLAQIVRESGLDDVHQRVLVQPFVSTSRAVQVLNRFASGVGAEFIVVGTHGRKGVGRAFLGSFAESLIHHATLPVITVGARKRELRNEKRILFTTEFGPDVAAAKSAFRRAVSLASEIGARLTLFHVLPQPVEPFIQSGSALLGGAWVPIDMYFSRAEERVREHAEAWTRWARNQGVTVDVDVESQAGRVSDTILKKAKELRAGWIIMEARTGPVVSALVGSVTRQVLRASECPVIILNQTRAEAARRPAAPAKAAA